MSLFSAYLLEMRGSHTIEWAEGFIVYETFDDVYHITDIYVAKEYRHRGVAQRLHDAVLERAKRAGAKTMMGTVNRGFNGADYSLKCHLDMGYKMLSAQNNIIVLTKEIE